MAEAKTKAQKEEEARAAKVEKALTELDTKGTKFAAKANDFVEQLLDQAEELETEKEELYGRVGANRETLRNILTTGLLSRDQARAVLTVYPPVARKEEEAAA